MLTPMMKRIIFGLERRGFFNCLSDKLYLKLLCYTIMDKKLELKNPKTFSEKLQWLKLYNRKAEYTMMVDKYLVREYIAKSIGEEYLIPLLGVWDDPNKIDFDALPEKFVLKCNHNSGLGMCICKDKSQLNLQLVKDELAKGMKQNYYLSGREWPYKNVKPLIIAEQFITDTGCKNEELSENLTDYKFFCFNGYVDSVMICVDRHINQTKYYFFDKDWNWKRYSHSEMEASPDFTFPKPKCIDEMFRIAAKLSKGLPFVRVDLYDCGGKIYFGELTFFSASGFDTDLLEETDEYFGKLIDLSIVKSNS